MPGTDISEMIESIKRVAPDSQILMLTGTKLDSQVMNLVSAGLDGYVLKDVEPHELKRQSVQSLVGRCIYNPPCGHMIDLLVINAQIAEQDLLTARELEVLNWMATSATYREIAAHLFISEETVRSHAKHILRKLGQPNRDAAVQEAIRLGILVKPGSVSGGWCGFPLSFCVSLQFCGVRSPVSQYELGCTLPVTFVGNGERDLVHTRFIINPPSNSQSKANWILSSAQDAGW